MDPRRHLLRNAWITLVASLALAMVLALSGRVSAANLSFDYGLVSVSSTLYWGPPSSPNANGFLHGPSESFTDHILFQTTSPFTAQFFNNSNNFSNFSALSVSLRDDVTHEPETYAMMLASLGLMGFVVRRRRQK